MGWIAPLPFPESVWAKGSSNSWVCHLRLSYIFTPSHLHILLSSHLTSSHSHLHIFTHSHLLFLSLTLTSSHLHIHILTSSLSLSSLSPFSLSLSFFFFLSLGRGRCRRGVMKRQPFRTKWRSIVKYWGKIAILFVPEQPFRTKWRSDRQKLRKNCNFICAGATLSHEMKVRSSNTEEKLQFYLCRSNPFARNEDRQKLWKNCNFTCAGATLSHERKVDRQKLTKNCDFATLSHEMRIVTNWGKIAILLVPEQPFRAKWGSMRKNWVKLRFYWCWM